jgi:hypothetical protein
MKNALMKSVLFKDGNNGGKNRSVMVTHLILTMVCTKMVPGYYYCLPILFAK